MFGTRQLMKSPDPRQDSILEGKKAVKDVVGSIDKIGSQMVG